MYQSNNLPLARPRYAADRVAVKKLITYGHVAVYAPNDGLRNMALGPK